MFTLRLTRLAVFAISSFAAVVARAQAPAVWDLPPFTAEPKALLAAGEKAGDGEHGAVILLDEARYTFGADGKTRTLWRRMYRVTDESAVTPLGQVAAPWSPWYNERPQIEARVVTKDGTVHTLDKSAVSEMPSAPDSLDIFSDDRIVRAPLPAVAVGSVVEYVITTDGNNPLADAGMTQTFAFARALPMQKVRLVLDGPADMQPRVVNRSGLDPRVDERDGRRIAIYETGPVAGVEDEEDNLPFDTLALPHIRFSTGKSWGDIARRYSEIVDKQIAGSDLQKQVRAAVGKATDRREIVWRVLAAIQKEIRYAGVEIAEGSIIPRSPRTVLTNQYGDCKDKATLLVAMLREAGLPAYVALLRAGVDLDVHAELPGLGQFNHAIAYVPGEPAIWVDPTDVYARAGEVPIADQGRMALIAAPDTTTITRIPEAKSTENVSTEARTFTMPEDGKPTVVEVSSAKGSDEAMWRRYAAESDRKSYREQMEQYVKSYYRAKSLSKLELGDPRALDKPFTITIEASESGNGMVTGGEAAIALHPAGLLEGLPYELRSWSEPDPNDTTAAKKEKPRVNDFLIPRPYTREWTYKLVPPAGYRPRTLPANETKKLGTMTLTKEFSTLPDGTILATMRFDSGKRRLTAAEYNETRVAVSRLASSDQFLVGFEQIGQAKLNEGDVGAALAEFRRLAAAHSKEAQHHVEIARALLAGGLGDAARDEIRRAIAIEPTNARAHEALGYILQHDSLGRAFKKGFDLPGAIAAQRKAVELKPTDISMRVTLARLLTIGDDGVQYSRGARLTEALEEYKKLSKDFGPAGKPYEADMLMILAYLGKFTEMKELAATLEDAQQRDLGRIIAIGATEGGAAAIRELGSFDQSTRRSYAEGASRSLLSLRRYPEAAQLLELSLQGAPNASERRPFVDMVRKTKRFEEQPLADDARVAMQQLLVAFGRGAKPEELRQLFSRDMLLTANDTDSDATAIEMLENKLRVEGMSTAVAMDLAGSNLQYQVEGNEKSGWRVRTRTPGAGKSGSMLLFVIRENGKYVIAATESSAPSIGSNVIRFAESGDLESARTWLNWTREEISAAGGDDPLAGLPFPMYWPKAKQNATLDEIRTAAAMLMVPKKTAARALPILLEARAKEQSDTAKAAIDESIVAIYSLQEDWASALPIAERLFTAYPDSPSAFSTYTTALAINGKKKEAEAIAAKRLERTPRDADALRALSNIALLTRDYPTAQKLAQRLIDETDPMRNDYNHAAWLALFTGTDYDRAVTHAQQASGGEPSPYLGASMHTLAALYAETGKSMEARAALLKSMEMRDHLEPDSDDWYVIGRIAENFGVRDTALAAYKKVTKSRTPGASSWELADKRLAAMAVKK